MILYDVDAESLLKFGELQQHMDYIHPHFSGLSNIQEGWKE